MMGSRDFAIQLLEAQNQQEVTGILREIESAWDVEWRNHGNQDLNNIQVVFNQAPDSVDAFSELLTNSIDAILIKRYCQKYNRETYNPDHNLITAHQAVDNLFDSDGDSETIEVTADGGDFPNLIVRDTGGGQSPEQFEQKFLHLASGKQTKADWPFAQGRFKMGASAVLPHCGDESERNFYKLILSSSYKNPGQWSWSLIRYDERAENEGFKYLSLSDGTPVFEGEIRGQSNGTFIKAYEYQLPKSEHSDNVTNITDRFVRHLNRSMVNPALEIDIKEKRDRFEGAQTSTVGGIYRRLEQPNVQRHLVFDKTHPGYRFTEPFGELHPRIVVFKDNTAISEDDSLSKKTKDRLVASTVHNEQAVFYLVNGQTHAQERRSFLTGKNGCNYSHTGEDTLVFIDLSEFADKTDSSLIDFVQFFSPSRDRLGQSEIATQFKNELIDCLMEFDALQNEDERRRNRTVKRKHDERIDNIVQNYIDRDPSLANYLPFGRRLRGTGTNDTSDYEFNPPDIPDELKIIKAFKEGGIPVFWDETDELFTHRQAVNRKSSLHLWLNAPDNYFTRERYAGEFSISVPSIRKSHQLNRGVLTIQFDEPTDFDPGDMLPIIASVTRPVQDDLKVKFQLKYVEPADPPSQTSTPNETEERQEGYNLPDPIEVYEDPDDGTSWTDVPGESFTQDDYVRLVDNGPAGGVEIDDLELYVNMDGGPIRHFFDQHNLNGTGREIVPEKWKVGLMLYSISGYKELVESGFKENGQMATDIVETTMRGTAQWLLTTHISEDELEKELTV